MVTPIHYKISYAQNYEDLILSGLLRDVEQGFYVDVGANHPELDSVTKIFYDRGWSGINVEPNDLLFAKLCADRARDINLKIGVASQPGTLKFRAYQSLDGLSTFSPQAMENMGITWPDAKYIDKPVEVTSLTEIFSEHRPTGEMHFLKIDVEGYEMKVLVGAEKLLKRDHPVLFVEINDENLVYHGNTASQLISYLANIGYTQFENTRTGKSVSATMDFTDLHFDLLARA